MVLLSILSWPVHTENDDVNVTKIALCCPRITNELVTCWIQRRKYKISWIFLKGSTSTNQDEITCILDYNRDDKSTTISITMTGLFPPSDGDCIMFGKSIGKNLNGLQEIMSVCPQHNIIYDDLSVCKYIRLCKTLKGEGQLV